jgi:hypothetical protein
LPFASPTTPRAGFKARAGRTRVEFCSKCKCRFSKVVLPGMEETSSSGPLLCPSCQSGEKKKSEPKKRRRITRTVANRKIGNDGYIEVPSLQDISIRVSYHSFIAPFNVLELMHYTFLVDCKIHRRRGGARRHWYN